MTSRRPSNSKVAPRPAFTVRDTRRAGWDSIPIGPTHRDQPSSDRAEHNQPATLSEREKLFAVKALFVESVLFHQRNSSGGLIDVLAARKAAGPVPCDIKAMTAERLVRIVLDDIERIHAMHPENGPKLALSAVSALPLWDLNRD